MTFLISMCILLLVIIYLLGGFILSVLLGAFTIIAGTIIVLFNKLFGKDSQEDLQ